MEQWEKNYYISSIAGANNGSSLVVMSKGMFTLFDIDGVSLHCPEIGVCYVISPEIFVSQCNRVRMHLNF
jgi:hypothetical protein